MPEPPTEDGRSQAAAHAAALDQQKLRWAARFAYEQRSSRDPQAAKPDYVRDLFRRTYVRTVDESAGKPLDSTIAWFVGTDAAFYMLRSRSSVEAKRSTADAEADGINGIVFDCVLGGRYGQTAGEQELVCEPGDLAMVQSNVEVVARSRLPQVASVFIPRYRVVETLGADASGPGFILRGLNNAPLAPFAVAAMRLLAKSYAGIPPEDFDAALDTTAGLLLRLLRREIDASREPRSALLDRAFAFMDEHYPDPTLSPEKICQGIGVSRARLYKLFAQNNLTVSGYLRDLRLRRFVEALRGAEEGTIGRLAWNCGIDMQAADFARMFKRSYGMTPREAQIALRAGRHVDPLAAGARRNRTR